MSWPNIKCIDLHNINIQTYIVMPLVIYHEQKEYRKEINVTTFTYWKKRDPGVKLMHLKYLDY